MIGRDAALAVLAEAVTAVKAGRPRIVLVAGDAGIGKTRLITEACTSAGLDITAREAEVLSLLAAGRTNREIAQALFISEKTASVHVSNLLRKLGAANRVEAAAIAQRVQLHDAAETRITEAVD